MASISIADLQRQRMFNIFKEELDWLDTEVNVKKTNVYENRQAIWYSLADGKICLVGKTSQW